MTRRLLHAICVLAAMVALQSCTVVWRGIRYGNASVDDNRIFPQDTVRNGEGRFTFTELPKAGSGLDTVRIDIFTRRDGRMHRMTLDETVEATRKPAAVIIIRNDSILYEHYAGGWNRSSRSNIFSVTKTVTSLMCGIALTEGYIKSLQDPVTDYIPELKDADPMFAELRIEHLLDMTAGLKFSEDYGWNPFSKMARLYMGRDAFRLIRGMKFSSKPGERYSYDSMTTAILGIVIERATGMSYARYLSERVWKPLGMEEPASVSLDSRKRGVAKSYAGLTTNVRDLAKIGKLFLDGGMWNGVRLVDSAYVKRCLSTNAAGKSSMGRYSYSWYWGFTDEEYVEHRFESRREMKRYFREHPESFAIHEHRNGDGSRTAVEYSQCRYFDDKESLKNFYATSPDADRYSIWKNRFGYYAVLHRGGWWGFGLYGQVLYINTEKNYIGVYLGQDRMKDFNIVFDSLYDHM